MNSFGNTKNKDTRLYFIQFKTKTVKVTRSCMYPKTTLSQLEDVHHWYLSLACIYNCNF